MPALSRPLRFVIPPTPGHAHAAHRARILARYLTRHLEIDVEVDVAQDDTHEGDLLAGRHADLGWAPPVVCARLELAGGRVVLRAERDGGSHYRAALVARADAQIDLTRPDTLTTAWVDQDSAGGYLLARSFFAARKIDIENSFRGTVFLGTYERCIHAVVEGSADITSVFATTANVIPARTAIDELQVEIGPRTARARSASTPVAPLSAIANAGVTMGTERAVESLRPPLRVLAFTGETFNDGIVLGPMIDEMRGLAITHALEHAAATDEGRRVLTEVFRADRFVSTGESAMRRHRAQPSA